MKSDSFLLGAGLTRHNTSAAERRRRKPVINSPVLPVGKEICDTRTYLSTTKAIAKAASCIKPWSAIAQGGVQRHDQCGQACDQNRRPDDQP
ncbi:hypothetical protein J4732_20910 [Serratia marcescens]|uniref:Uncharacterized protein n=1 Tax=Serratia marcescens TaxID=615 RepID=A0A939NRZ9_SERMA|nr:hypothetical protein [Serratia marcescens]